MDSGLVMGLVVGVALTLIVVNYFKDNKKDSNNVDPKDPFGGSGDSITTKPKK